MIKFRSTTLAFAFFGLCATMLSGPARAQGYPVFDAQVILAIQRMETDIGTRVSAVTSALSTMDSDLGTRITTLTNAVDASSAKTASAVSNAAENANVRQMDVVAEQHNIDSEKNSRTPLDPCANAARGLGNVDMDRSQPALRTGATRPSGMGAAPGASGGGVSTGSPVMDRAIAISERNAPAPSPEIQKMVAMQGACAAYAVGGQAGGRASMCAQAGVTQTGLTSGFPNADVRADTLYDGAQTQANTGKISLTWTPEQLTAARAFQRNLHAAVEPVTLSKDALNSNVGRQYLALRDQYLARTAQAQKAEDEWINNMAPNPDTIPVLQAMMAGGEAAATYLTAQLPKENPQWASKGVSFNSFLSLDVDRRYANPAWSLMIASASDPLTLQREQLMISAQTNYLLNKMLMEMRKSELMQGSVYQAELARDLMPLLLDAQRAANQGKSPS